MTETDEDFGLIFRPQLGVTSLTVGDETKMGGHLGLNLGYKKFSGLKLTKIGFYSRTRGLFLPTVGETFALDTRLGSFVGLKVSAFEIETGVDVLYHSISASGLTLPDDTWKRFSWNWCACTSTVHHRPAQAQSWSSTDLVPGKRPSICRLEQSEHRHSAR